MPNKRDIIIKKWKVAHPGVWQFILFSLMSGITTLVDLGSFALFNFWLLTPYRGQAFCWGPFQYTIKSGGLTAFVAFAASFAISQTFNFFLQRKKTFKANNNAAASAAMYALMIVGVYALQLYLPTVLRAPIVGLLGATTGDLAMKLVNITVSMRIQFLMDKYVIMRKTKVSSPNVAQKQE